MRITIVGSGYVGLVAGACFAELGHEVTLVDNDPEKIAALERGEVPIHEDHLPELIQRHRGNRLSFTGSLHDAVRASSIVFIAVGTPPTENGEADLSYVEAVAREVAGALDSYKILVEKSTVPVFTNGWIRRVMTLNGASPALFDIASNPEFLREGTAVTDFLYADRIVIGTDSPRCAEILEEVYRPLVDGSYARSATAIPRPTGSPEKAELVKTSAQSAELIKHACNAFLAMKISFINAVANICESVGADVEEVCHGIGTDSRIGSRFLRPGIGYGGSCFPKDLKAFRAVATECGYDFSLLDEVMQINEDQRTRFLKKLRGVIWNFKNKRLGVLGLAFKGGTDDIRESPAIGIISSLLKEGVTISVYDPAAMERSASLFGNQKLTFAQTPYDAAEGADALLILTDWAEFATLDLVRLKHCLAQPIIVDGRNLYPLRCMQEHGFHYVSVGRHDVELKQGVPAK